MQYIDRDEFEQLADMYTGASYTRVNFPEPCKRITRINGIPTPVWSMEVAEAYIQTKVKLDYTEVKRLNDKGLTRKQMARKLNIKIQKLASFCRYNNIVSLVTIKDSRSRRKTPKIQAELFPAVRVLNTFERYLFDHCKVTPEAEATI